MQREGKKNKGGGGFCILVANMFRVHTAMNVDYNSNSAVVQGTYTKSGRSSKNVGVTMTHWR